MKWTIALALLLAPTEALAADWKEVARSSDDDTIVWLDMSSIRKGKENMYAWWRMKMSGGQYSVALTAFDCAAKTTMDLQLTIHETNGSANVMDKRLSGQWKFAAPDSVMEGVVDAVCGESW